MIVVVSIVLILVVVGYLQPKEINVSKSAVVQAPACAVFDHVNDVNKRLAWSPWEKMDTTMVTTVGEITKGEGASYSWTSESSGAGELTYTKVIANERVESTLDFGEMGVANASMMFEEVEDGTKVTWTFNTDMGSGPFQRLLGIVMKPAIEQSFTAGLKSLAASAEADKNNPACHEGQEAPSVSDMGEVMNESPVEGLSSSIVELTMPTVAFVSVIDSSDVASMSAQLGAGYGRLMGYMEENAVPFHTAPICLYHKFEPPTKVVFQPAMTVTGEVPEAEGMVMGTLSEGMYVRVTHIGPYETMEPAWNALEAYVNENGFTVRGYPFEEYINDPQSTAPEELITHIYFPVDKAQS